MCKGTADGCFLCLPSGMQLRGLLCGMQTQQDNMQAFLAAVGGMVQYAREDEAVQLQTVSPTFRRCLPALLQSLDVMANLGGAHLGLSLEVFLPCKPQACM